jgi:hypothetical protein
MHRVQWISPDWKRARGLGFAVLRQDDRTLVGHGGTLPGYQTSFMTSPEEKIAVIALTNADDGQPGPGGPASIVDRAFKWVAPALRKAASPPPIAPRPKPEWEAYLGTYRGAWADTVVTILKGRLALINPLDGDPGATRLTLAEIGPHAFRTESAAPFGQDGDTVV